MNSVLLGQYDFVILGTHPAALWGAILLLERDLKVLVLPMLTTPATASSPIYSIPLIDEHPSHRFIPQFILDSILKDIPADQFHVTQLLTRDRRLRVFRKDNEFQEEWNFVLGKNANSEQLTSDKNTLKTTGALRRGLGYYVRGYESAPLFPEDLKFMISNQGSVFDLKPKATSLPHFLFRKIEALGGHIDFRACQSVFIDKKVLVGIQLVGNPTMVSISQAIIATSINKVQACLSEPLLIQSQPVGWNFEIRIQVSPEAVPIGATSKMIYTDDDAAIVEIIQIDAGDYILRTMMPMKDFTLDREYQRKIAQRLVKLFSNYVPDLEYNLRSVFPDIRDPERAETRDLVDRYPFTHLASIPHSILSYAIPGLGHQSSVQGISFAYEESYPRFGHWGAYQAAFLSIQDWAKKVQRTDFSTILPPLAVAVSR